jgi:uncharacterized protein YeaO (DUF488 family)
MASKPALHPALASKRVYAPPGAGDGVRVLVDRLWPRGLSKDKAKIDLWLRDIAPSDALRRLHANVEAWDAFVIDYGLELAQEPAASAARNLLACIRQGPVTLLYAGRNEVRNNASVLKAWLERRLRLEAGRRQAAAMPGGRGQQTKAAKRKRPGAKASA